MQALILAAGLGTRLRPLTHDSPVPLLFLPGGSLLDRLLYQLEILGIRRIAVVLQHRGDQLARHLAAYPHIETIPQKAPFHLLSALSSARAWVKTTTLVLHGNTLFPHGLQGFLAESEHHAPTVLLPMEGGPQLRDFSAYLLRPDHFDLLDIEPTDDTMDALVQHMADRGHPFIPVPTFQRILPVRTADDLLDASRYLLSHWHEIAHPPGASGAYDAMNFNWIAPDAMIDRDSHLLFTAIGPEARLEACKLHNTLVLPKVPLAREHGRDAVFSAPARMLLHPQWGPQPTLS